MFSPKKSKNEMSSEPKLERRLANGVSGSWPRLNTASKPERPPRGTKMPGSPQRLLHGSPHRYVGSPQRLHNMASNVDNWSLKSWLLCCFPNRLPNGSSLDGLVSIILHNMLVVITTLTLQPSAIYHLKLDKV